MSASKDRVVVITGGAGQLGRAVEKAFARTGSRRVMIDIDEAALHAAYPTGSSDRLLISADLTDAGSVERAIATAVDKFGSVEILCNIAGGFYYGEPVHQMKLDVWRRMLDLNAVTLISAVRAVVPVMMAAGKGTIINVGAASHQRGHANMSAYAAAKGAVMRLTESMAEELRTEDIGVFCVMPEIIDTPANRVDMPAADTSSWTPPSAIADAMVLLAEDAALIMSGGLFSVKGRPRALETK
ncbi:SDR family NAD(P)-dependent oxidoreductase [Paraburkholderia sp. GAS32]|uniref:SDR family NAD(P)-dependent oxidoreductase n=1 Tax=Paraburkholderia sp. GAS32 TaxID=3035129 RepID=UPI003D24A3A6